jgi:hypothetical protein
MVEGSGFWVKHFGFFVRGLGQDDGFELEVRV